MDRLIYLPTIELSLDQRLQMFGPDFRSSFLCLRLFKKARPDTFSGILIQIFVFQQQMNSTENCLIKFGHPVHSKEQNPSIIFKLAQKDRYKAVTMQILG
jgi:hypothetical protein